ncbi:FKBP-type peptidyl-prolyl cis-trans isomerase [Phenylobacterium aquaticum]|uniref:FKBP-type peptidyl-prolyl cis-trans isomerase n=1 Tax=Phenylobacterium aquaticum TaxID=1763816 RepID=UPI0026EF5264|nr:FKBP-type peptidyl-prolyl cis-trans isomerase [Phenylobacterium aquaticum]
MKRLFVVLACAMALAGCGPDKKAAAENLTAAKAFLATNAKDPAVHVLPDGLQFKVVRTGPADGLRPQKQDEVKVHYEGKLLGPPGQPLAGKVFDSSYDRGVPASFPLNGLIPAWIEALALMRPGDEWILYVPPELGYGEQGAGGGDIPANSVLIFRIELLGVLPGVGRIGAG